MWGALIGAAAGLIGGRMTNSAQNARQEDAQAFNTVEAEKQREWSAAQAQAQMDFQERMANTAYQRGMSDMKTAGLNPILAYSQGGAATPSGAQGSASAASSPAPQPVRNAVAEAVASAQQVAQLDLVAANVEKTRAEAAKTRTEEAHLKEDFVEHPDRPGQFHEIGTITSRERQMRVELLKAQRNVEVEREPLTQEQRKLVEEEVKNAIEQRRAIQANTRNANANAVLAELAKAEAEANYRFHSNHPNIAEYGQGLKYLGSVVNSAARVRGMFNH